MSRKAYCCSSGDYCDGVLLVYAENRNQAKYITSSAGLYEWEYVDIRAIRVKNFDEYYCGRSVIETNNELPDGSMLFYDDEYFDE